MDMNNAADLRLDLERAYRAIRGLYDAAANGEMPEKHVLHYHSLTIGAAIRFVDDGELDSPDYFVGKHVDVLRDTLSKAVRRGGPT